MSFLQLVNLHHRYGNKPVLRDLSLDVDEGAFVSLLGPSGCGKTTILKLIAGFEQPTGGTIKVAGEVLNGIPANRRNMGMVFQSYALFPHMTVIDNVAYGLRQRNQSRNEARTAARQALQLVQLPGMEDRKPAQLSGGQQQRVALARAIVMRPRLLLLDESLSALDRKLRIEMQVELRRIQREVGITTLFVTHDQEEALTLSDRVALLNEGEIAQYDIPAAIYERPCSSFVASFIGEANFFAGIIKGKHAEDSYIMQTEKGQIIEFGYGESLEPNTAYSVAVRPEKITIATVQSSATPFSGRVTLVTYAGDVTKYAVAALDMEWTVQAQNNQTGTSPFSVGDELFFGWDGGNSLVWRKDVK